MWFQFCLLPCLQSTFKNCELGGFTLHLPGAHVDVGMQQSSGRPDAVCRVGPCSSNSPCPGCSDACLVQGERWHFGCRACEETWSGGIRCSSLLYKRR